MIKNCLRLFLVLGALTPAVMLVACESAETISPDTYQGTIELEERVLGFEAAGRVQRVEVQRGQLVEAGQVLARLDPSLEELTTAAREADAAAAAAQAELVREGARAEDVQALAARVRAAQAAADVIRRDLERERALVQRGVSPSSRVIDLEGQLERALAERQSLDHQLRALREGARKPEVASADARARAAELTHAIEKERLERYVLRAHEPGTVLDLHAEPGEVVSTGTPVVSVADRTRPYADVFVPQAELGGLDVGDRARVRIDAHERELTGQVEYIAPKTEFTPRFLFSDRERPNLVVRVRIRIDDPERALYAGVPAFVTIERGSPGAAPPAGPQAQTAPAAPAAPQAPQAPQAQTGGTP